MTNAFSSMAYPHWLIVAGAVLLMLGIVGLALCRRGAEPWNSTTSQVGRTKAVRVGKQSTEPNANRKAGLRSRRRNRWANTLDSGSEERR